MKVAPSDFIEADFLAERPTGTEDELSVQNRAKVAGEIREFELPLYIGSKAVEATGRKKVHKFLGNGSKLDIDCGGKIELSTREGLGAEEAADENIHGIEVVQEIVSASGIPHNGVYREAGSFIFQGSHCGAFDFDEEHGATSGFHHSYLIPRSIATGDRLELLVHVLGSHLATRVWAWGGTINHDGFVLSQKLWGIGAPVSMGYGRRTSPGEKPLAAIRINKDEDVIRSGSGWARFEDRSPDPAFSVEILELTLATTSLALRLVEQSHRLGKGRLSGHDRLLQAVGLKNQVAAAHDFAGDLTLKKTTETLGGERLTALDVQERLARLAIELVEKEDVFVPIYEERAAYAWLKRVQELRKCQPDRGEYVNSVLEGTHFAPRHLALLQRFKPHELNVGNPKAALINARWDMILPPGIGQRDPEGLGLSYWRGHYRRKGKAWPVDLKPPRTRAALRQALLQSSYAVDADWNFVKHGAKPVWTRDPFQTELEEVA